MKESLTVRILAGVTAGIIAGGAVVAWLALDYLWWQLLPVQAESLGAFVAGLWFVPAAVALIAAAIGVWKGGGASLDFAVRTCEGIWQDLKFW